MSAPTKTQVFDLKFPLTPLNYKAWVFRLSPWLLAQDLATTVPVIDDGPNVFTVKNVAAVQVAIVSNCSEEVVQLLEPFGGDPVGMWDFLANLYSGVKNGRKLAGIRSMANFAMDPSFTVAKNISILQATCAATETASGSPDISLKDFALAMLMNSLPSSFDAIRVTLSSSISFKDAVEKIIAEEQIQLQRNPVTPHQVHLAVSEKCNMAHVGFSQNDCWKCNPEKSPANATCRDCRKVGHFSKTFIDCKFYAKKRVYPNNVAHFVDQDQGQPFNPRPPHQAFALGQPRLEEHERPYLVADNPKRDHSPARADLRSRITSSSAKKVKRSRSPCAELRSSTSTMPVRKAIDSGASISIFKNKAELQNYSQSSIQIATANSSSLYCPGHGDALVAS